MLRCRTTKSSRLHDPIVAFSCHIIAATLSASTLSASTNTASKITRGIVVCSFDPDFIAQAQRIHQAVEAQSEMDNQLIRVNRPG
jgi:hypothetical protein